MQILPIIFRINNTLKWLIKLKKFDILNNDGEIIIEHSSNISLFNSNEKILKKGNMVPICVKFYKKSKPISRILSSLIIYLDVILLLHSYRLPFYIKRAILKCRFTWRFTMQSLQDSTTALPVHTFCCTIPIYK